MKEENLIKYLTGFQKNSRFRLIWDRGNGVLEKLVRFDGFDENGKPEFYLQHNRESILLDLDKIGDYSFISISPKCPDGYCVSQEVCPDGTYCQDFKSQPDGMC